MLLCADLEKRDAKIMKADTTATFVMHIEAKEYNTHVCVVVFA
jgi:hypothetical protein